MRGGGEGGGRKGEFGVSFERLKGWGGRGATEICQVRTTRDWGSKFRGFCDDVIIDCPHLFYI